jgi:hypothetical protein
MAGARSSSFPGRALRPNAFVPGECSNPVILIVLRFYLLFHWVIGRLNVTLVWHLGPFSATVATLQRRSSSTVVRDVAVAPKARALVWGISGVAESLVAAWTAG